MGTRTKTTKYIMHINGTIDVENGQPARTIERSRLLGLGTNEDPTALESDEYGIRNVYKLSKLRGRCKFIMFQLRGRCKLCFWVGGQDPLPLAGRRPPPLGHLIDRLRPNP